MHCSDRPRETIRVGRRKFWGGVCVLLGSHQSSAKLYFVPRIITDSQIKGVYYIMFSFTFNVTFIIKIMQSKTIAENQAV